MNLCLTALLVAAGCIAVPAAWSMDPGSDAKPAAPASMPAADPTFVLSYVVKDIDGKDYDLAQLKGRVVLIVNVASKCGLTPQYEGLEALYESKQDKGFVIVAFPSNDFRGQEPGTEADIKAGCVVKYKVTFPMMSKVGVLGDKRHPLYKQLADLPAPIGGDASWNFTKYLVSREGKVVAKFDPQTKPGDEALVKAIDEQLAAKGDAAPSIHK